MLDGLKRATIGAAKLTVQLHRRGELSSHAVLSLVSPSSAGAGERFSGRNQYGDRILNVDVSHLKGPIA